VSKLLVGRTESDGLTTIYRYDQHGRLIQTVLPDGERYTFDATPTSTAIRISLERDNPVELTISGAAIQSGEKKVLYNLMKNGSSVMEWAGDNQYSFQPLQQGGSEGWSERLQLSGGSAIRGEWAKSLQVGSSGSRSQDKTIRINGAKFLVAEIDGQSGGRQLYDNDRQLVMGFHCDTQGHLKELRLPPGFHGIRYNYDGYFHKIGFNSLHYFDEPIYFFAEMAVFKAGYGVNDRKSTVTTREDCWPRLVPGQTLAIQDRGQSFTVLTMW
jgi:YD repeat-containing protein